MRLSIKGASNMCQPGKGAIITNVAKMFFLRYTGFFLTGAVARAQAQDATVLLPSCCNVSQRRQMPINADKCQLMPIIKAGFPSQGGAECR